MKPISKHTLALMIAELPTFAWSDADLDELVAPKFGVITGFQSFLDEVDAVARLDLDEIGPAGVLGFETPES